MNHRIPTLVLLASLLLGCALAVSPTAVSADPLVNITINGQPSVSGVAPFQWENTVFMALRRILPSLGSSTTNFTPATSQVTVNYGNHIVVYSLTQPLAIVDGKSVTLSATPVLRDGVLYLSVADINKTLHIPVVVTGPVQRVAAVPKFIPPGQRKRPSWKNTPPGQLKRQGPKNMPPGQAKKHDNEVKNKHDNGNQNENGKHNENENGNENH